MAVGCQQDEVWRQGLLGVGPYGGGGVGLAVEAGSQVIVAAAMAVFGLGKGKDLWTYSLVVRTGQKRNTLLGPVKR